MSAENKIYCQRTQNEMFFCALVTFLGLPPDQGNKQLSFFFDTTEVDFQVLMRHRSESAVIKIK